MDTGEVDARTRTALDLACGSFFGTEPGRLPSILLQAYDASTAHLDRAVRGAALARCWACAGERNRALTTSRGEETFRDLCGDRDRIGMAL